jgi:hypothetical protein
MSDLREKLATLEHERWAHWQRWMHDQGHRRDGVGAARMLILPAELADRWERQIATPYADLSEAEKDSDRQEADRTLAAVAEVLRERETIRAVQAASPCNCSGCQIGAERALRWLADSIAPPKGDKT